ncbi:MAG TPA: hypothetical protein QGH10_13930, partial [Armatimonadota bacterium]|nr:hypothetical protein [Armatimonadota bacterium]
GAALPAPAAGLLVRFSTTDGWELEVDRSGDTRVTTDHAGGGEPVGLFEGKLGQSRTRELVRAVMDATRAGLDDDYPPSDGDEARCSIELPTGSGFRTVAFAARRRHVPEALRVLYNDNTGLLVSAYKRALPHPTSAIAGFLAVEARTYKVGEPIAPELIIRSVGTRAVAFPTPDTQHLASGRFQMGLFRSSGLGPGGDWARLQWGPDFYQRPLSDLTPEALLDAGNIRILAPGDEYRLPVPRALIAPLADTYELYAWAWMQARYTEEALASVIEAPLVTGSVSAPFVWIDVVD